MRVHACVHTHVPPYASPAYAYVSIRLPCTRVRLKHTHTHTHTGGCFSDSFHPWRSWSLQLFAQRKAMLPVSRSFPFIADFFSFFRSLLP